MTDKPCSFCKGYDSWKSEGKVLYENNVAYSILNITPAVPGHATIIPFKHVKDLLFLSRAEISDVIFATRETFRRVQQLQPSRLVDFYTSLRDNPPVDSSSSLGRAIVESAGSMLTHPALRVIPNGYNFGVNVGESAGQSIEHAHVHMFPRNSDQGKNGIVTMVRDALSGRVS